MRALFLFLLLLLPGLAYAEVNLAMAPIDRLSLPWWKERWEATLREAKETPNARIVWLGDSITQNWLRQGQQDYDDYLPVWNKYYAPYHALDFGFIGDTTASLIWRLDHGQVKGLHPALAIILIGANNFGLPHWDAQKTVPGIESVVNITHRDLPGAHILLIGVLPSIRSPWVDEQTVLTNNALASIYAKSADVTFVNLKALFIANGKVNPAFFLDPHLRPDAPPLHPDAPTMARMAQALEPYVVKYAGQPAP